MLPTRPAEPQSKPRELGSGLESLGGKGLGGSFHTERVRCILLPEVIPMPVPTRAKEPLIETLPLEERIRRRAYELYVQRGNQSGSEFDDWLQAEEEMIRAQEAVIDEAEPRRRG